MTNGLQSEQYGLEVILQTDKIKAINTSFNFSTNYAYGNYSNKSLRIESVASTFGNDNENKP